MAEVSNRGPIFLREGERGRIEVVDLDEPALEICSNVMAGARAGSGARAPTGRSGSQSLGHQSPRERGRPLESAAVTGAVARAAGAQRGRGTRPPTGRSAGSGACPATGVRTSAAWAGQRAHGAATRHQRIAARAARCGTGVRMGAGRAAGTGAGRGHRRLVQRGQQERARGGGAWRGHRPVAARARP